MPPSSPRSAGPLPLTLRLLGPGGLWLGGEAVALPTRKALGLVAYLALEGPTSRSRLADLFWSENDEESARRNLRRELHRLRGTALRERLRADEKAVGLEGPLEIDVARFQALLERGEAEAALGMYGGALLEGLELPGAAGFAEWLQGWREQLDRQRQRALLYRAENLETRGDWRGALEIHLQLLAEDSLQERHHREVMRLHYLLGEREAALDRFERFRGLLKQELGLEPLPETLLLAQQIRTAQAPKPAAVQTLAPAFALHPPFVGRKAVLEQMEAAWEARQLIVLSGEPGVGKTRLALEFALNKGLLQTNQGRPTDLKVPFSTLSRSTREMLQQNPNLQLPHWVRQELARLVPELSERPPPPLEQREELLRLYEAFALLTDLATRDKAALFSDDVQFFDASSVEMGLYTLQRISEQKHRRGLLAAFRTSELQPEVLAMLKPVLDSNRGVQIELDGLAESELLELVRRMSGSGEGRLFSRRLYKTTAGNPFFVLETLKTLFESGLLSVNAQGGWETPYDEETTDYRELPVPASVREAVLRRVGNLGGAVRRLLEAASLAGDGFRPETLQGATALTEWEALEALERAAEARILEAMPTGGYRFTHDLFAQSLAEALSPERKRLLHLKLALSLERLGGPPARVAEHLEQAGKPQDAIPWRIRAAEAAQRVFAHQDALNHLNQAIAHTTEPHEIIRLRTKVFRIYECLALPERWQSDLAALEAVVETLGDPVEQVNTELEWVHFLIWHSRDSEALARIEWVLLQPHLTLEQRAWALEYRAHVLVNLGRLEESDQARIEVIKLLGSTPSALRGRAMYGRLMNAYKRGEYAVAREWAARCRQEFTAIGATTHLINVCTMEGILAAILGDISSAIGLLEHSRNEARRIGQTTHLMAALFNLFEVLFESGDIPGAQATLEEAAQARPIFYDPFEEAAFRRYQSQLAWFTGELGQGLDKARLALELDEKSNIMEHRLLGRLVLSGLYLELGNHPTAENLLDEVEMLRAESSIAFFDFSLGLKLAQLELNQGQAAQALRRLEELEALLPSARAAELTQRSLLLARARLACGDPNGALAALEALYEAQAIEVRLEALALKCSLDPRPAVLHKIGELLHSKHLPAIKTLELRRALIRAFSTAAPKKAKKLRKEAALAVQSLARTLESHPEQKQAFLQLNQDLTLT